MLSSLRSRLWISYAFLTLVALVIVAVGLVLALSRNPLLYQQTVLKMRVAESVIIQRIADFTNPNGVFAETRIETMLRNQADSRALRISVLSASGSVLVDFGISTSIPLPVPKQPYQTTDSDPNQVLFIRDNKGNEWLYTLHELDPQRYLMVSAPRPSLTLKEILRGGYFEPFLQAALAALVLGIILSLILGQWISGPMHHMADSARKMAEGKYDPIRISGPSETRQLGEALNEMANRVQVSQQSQRDFIGNVSHELKTPLTSIQGFAQAILDGAAQTPEALQQAAGVIYNEAGRMHRLVLDLLALARLEGGTADLERAPVDLPVLLTSIIDRFKVQSEQAQVKLELGPAPATTIIGDGDRLLQVFTNLVDNALKFTPAGGQVWVSTSVVDGNVVVRVQDTGIGIAAEDQKRIFERFYQVDKSRPGGGRRGVGLGLAIASQIVHAHGGRIWVESALGHGSTFSVSLPILHPDAKPATARRA